MTTQSGRIKQIFKKTVSKIIIQYDEKVNSTVGNLPYNDFSFSNGVLHARVEFDKAGSCGGWAVKLNNCMKLGCLEEKYMKECEVKVAEVGQLLLQKCGKTVPLRIDYDSLLSSKEYKNRNDYSKQLFFGQIPGIFEYGLISDSAS